MKRRNGFDTEFRQKFLPSSRCWFREFLFLAIFMSDAPPQIDQLAGHQGNIVPLGGGKIKKLVKEREAAFYNSLEDRKLSPTIMKYIPTFYGIEVATNGSKSLTVTGVYLFLEYIIIEDLTANYGKEANVMDMKMGTTR